MDNVSGFSLALGRPRIPSERPRAIPWKRQTLPSEESPDLAGQFSQIALASAEQPHVHRDCLLRQYLDKPLGLRERHRKKRKP